MLCPDAELLLFALAVAMTLIGVPACTVVLVVHVLKPASLEGPRAGRYRGVEPGPGCQDEDARAAARVWLIKGPGRCSDHRVRAVPSHTRLTDCGLRGRTLPPMWTLGRH
jgi:hypothetical protein